MKPKNIYLTFILLVSSVILIKSQYSIKILFFFNLFYWWILSVKFQVNHLLYSRKIVTLHHWDQNLKRIVGWKCKIVKRVVMFLPNFFLSRSYFHYSILMQWIPINVISIVSEISADTILCFYQKPTASIKYRVVKILEFIVYSTLFAKILLPAWNPTGHVCRS